MQWWQRLGRIIETRHLQVPEVAKAARVSVKSLYGYLQGDVDHPRGDVVRRLAGAVGMSEQELRYGGAIGTTDGNKRIPLIPMTKLARLKITESPLSAWDGVSTIQVPADIPEGCLAVTITDEANAPEFPLGSIVVCDPKVPVIPGRYVVVLSPDTDEALLGRYRPLAHGSAKRFKLIRSNPDYPQEIEFGGRLRGHILARAIKHLRDI